MNLYKFVLVVIIGAALSAGCGLMEKREDVSTLPFTLEKLTSHKGAADRNVKSDPQTLFLAFERRMYKGAVDANKAPESFEIVRYDMKRKKEEIIPGSEGGSEPSVASDGTLMYRKGDVLYIAPPDLSGPQQQISLKSDFSTVIKPSISPDGKKIALIGRRAPGKDRAAPQNGSMTPQDNGLYVIDVEKRKIIKANKEMCPPGIMTDVTWSGARELLVYAGERGDQGKKWERAMFIGLDSQECRLAYFGDAGGGKWAANPSAKLYAHLYPGESGADKLVQTDFSKNSLETVDFKSYASFSCLDDVLLIPDASSLILSCRNGKNAPYGISVATWRHTK